MTNTKTKELIAEIHNSFNTAGERLLSEAMVILNPLRGLEEKAERLKMAGFTSANEVKQFDSLEMTRELADTIQFYQHKYPNNKFITDEQVQIICKKYKLVCGPSDRYKGFVPESKLSQIESFKCDERDFRTSFCTNIKWSYPSTYSKEIKVISDKYPDGLFPIPDRLGRIDGIYVSSYDEVKVPNLFICAPVKDMDMNLVTISIPDPVVLKPVKGGYLIVAAWGDEASDEIVVNNIHN